MEKIVLLKDERKQAYEAKAACDLQVNKTTLGAMADDLETANNNINNLTDIVKAQQEQIKALIKVIEAEKSEYRSKLANLEFALRNAGGKI